HAVRKTVRILLRSALAGNVTEIVGGERCARGNPADKVLQREAGHLDSVQIAVVQASRFDRITGSRLGADVHIKLSSRAGIVHTNDYRLVPRGRVGHRIFMGELAEPGELEAVAIQ